MSKRFLSTPEEVRTSWFHAEFHMQEGVIRFRGLRPGSKGFHLIPGPVKFTLDLQKLREFPRFWALLQIIVNRWTPIPGDACKPS